MQDYLLFLICTLLIDLTFFSWFIAQMFKSNVQTNVK